MSMRSQFVRTVESLLQREDRLVLLLGDIGVFGFRSSFQRYPDRVYNIGILEQSTISVAAGLAKEGFIPIVHTIAPFLIERSLEQLKIDFCYQGFAGNFISVGGSYDYAALGCTHHCPGDVGMLKNVPGMELVLPGSAKEFDLLFHQTFSNSRPTYFRLSERENSISHDVAFGKACIVRAGRLATIVAVGPVLDQVLQAAQDLDVTILYYTTVSPFDAITLQENIVSSKILVCEPYYTGGVSADILNALKLKPIIVDSIGVPRTFLTQYGCAEDHDQCIGITAENIRSRLQELIHAEAR